MKKLKMARGVTLTFEEGCNKYLENCRQRNLREGTINHYRQSYLYFYKYFDPKMPIEDIDEQLYAYCRVSTQHQKLARQITNITAIYPTATIIKEFYTGTKQDRPNWNKPISQIEKAVG